MRTSSSQSGLGLVEFLIILAVVIIVIIILFGAPAVENVNAASNLCAEAVEATDAIAEVCSAFGGAQ